MKVENVKWESQSQSSIDSMPVGGHSIGANVWVENGELFLYIQQSGWFDENNSMLKLGRLRIKCDPAPFEHIFSQELVTEEGYIQITGEDMSIRIWIDTEAPVFHIQGESKKRVRITATYENWRTHERKVPSDCYELFQCKEVYLDPNQEATFYPDHIQCGNETLIIYHQNNNEALSIYKLLKEQKLENLKPTLYNPQENLISGGKIIFKDMTYEGKVQGQYLDTPYEGFVYKQDRGAKQFEIHGILHSDIYKESEEWLQNIEDIEAQYLIDLDYRFEKTKVWWQEYFAKSFIHISKEGKWGEIGQNYGLFQYMLASNYSGKWPTKFNGGLFTVDPGYIERVEWHNGRLHYTPDYRLWGGGAHTIQNQRLVYWPMLRSGDAQVMKQQFDLMKRSLKNAKQRTRYCFGCEGAVFPEQMNTYGLCNNEDQGWGNTTGWPYKEHIRYLFSNSLEICHMILKYYTFTQESIEEYKDFIHSILAFYNDFYDKNNEQGKMIIYPAGALETYSNVKNPIDAIAGLRCVLTELLEVDEKALVLTDEDRKWYEKLLERVPEIQYKKEKGKIIIAYGEGEGKQTNCEIPETYAIFPYELFGIGRTKLEVAKDTITLSQRTKEQRSHVSWHTNGIEYTRCGMVEEASEFLKKKLGNGEHRFPAFWGPGHDWIPDFNWGGSGALQLQEMLLQEYKGNIYILPCWDKEVPVHFRLYCTGKGIVECYYDGISIQKLITEPKDLMSRIIVGIK